MVQVEDARYPGLMRTSVLACGATFILIFPLTIIIKLYAAFGIFPFESNFNGLRNMALALCAVMCALNILLNSAHWLRLISVSLYVLLIGYIGVVLILNTDQYGYMGDSYVSSAKFHHSVYLKYIFFCVLGTHLCLVKPLRHVILIATVVSCVVIVNFVDFTTYRINVAEFTEEANRSNYQAIGDALAITALLAIALYSNNVLRIALAIFVAIVLFLVGSRTSFAVFSFTAFIYVLVSFRVWWLICLSILLFALSMLYLESIDWADIEASNPRMVRIFTDYENDASIQGRKERDQIGWEDISNSPVFGNFGGQREFGGWGGYMHNVLSYWRQFGVLPFLAIVCLYSSFFYVCFRKFRRRLEPYYSIPFLIGTFQIAESLISRSFAFANTHLVFGLLIAFSAWSAFGDRFMSIGPKAKTGNSGKGAKRKRRRKRRVTQMRSA